MRTRPLLKFASFEMIECQMDDAGSQSLMRTAHRVAFNYSPRPGYLYIRSRAISSRCNDNFDEFPAEEIKKSWRTFIGKPVFVNHENSDHRRARGVIVDAALHEDINPDGSPDTWVEVLMEVDAVNFPKLAQEIVKGNIDRTSMGTDVGYSRCSVCDNKATTPLEYCSHIKHHKGERIRRWSPDGQGEEVLVREICYKLSFFENSLLVENPADPTAFFLGVESGDDLVAAGQKTASRQRLTRRTNQRTPMARNWRNPSILTTARSKSVEKDEVATMVDALAGLLRDSEFSGLVDMCDVSVKGTNLFCDGNKGIPRSRMPQLEGNGKDVTEDWKQSLIDEGIRVTDENVVAHTLKATQSQLVAEKVAGITKAMQQGKIPESRIFVSRDSYVVDGHHRWAAKVCLDLLDGRLGDVRMPVSRIDLPIEELIKRANEFAKANGIAQKSAAELRQEDLTNLANSIITSAKIQESQKRRIAMRAHPSAGVIRGRGRLARNDVDKDEVATMVDALAGVLRDSEFSGIVNLCDVSVKGTNLFCSDSKGIPRAKMPQLQNRQQDVTEEWKQSLIDEGIRVTDETVKAHTLKATQSQLRAGLVAEITKLMEKGQVPDTRIFISRDNYIIDGHHRWAAKVCLDLLDGRLGDVTMPVSRIQLSIEELLERANDFARLKGIPQKSAAELGLVSMESLARSIFSEMELSQLLSR